ncbi:protein Nef [Streptomyces azureus]|uniref:Protein Nef n=1 Tax=Streptomyces azureus TaxID=146537 RepID=A0A0K8PLP9_STRAJ|nr:protein Nef [Streptomyces azureus]
MTVGKAEGALVARHMENASPGVEAANGVGSVASVAEQHTGLLLTGVLHGLLG